MTNQPTNRPTTNPYFRRYSLVSLFAPPECEIPTNRADSNRADSNRADSNHTDPKG